MEQLLGAGSEVDLKLRKASSLDPWAEAPAGALSQGHGALSRVLHRLWRHAIGGETLLVDVLRA